MKIADPKEFIYRSEDMPTVGFQIKASAKAFRILSSGLYSNKVLAVIRELSTNAYDSHVVNGNPDKPFDVHLPQMLDNTFYIRDYGTGIEPEKIKTVYTVYFESDKTNSNDLTGCLGLGSKSPFSYTKSFTIENFYSGKLYIYSAYLNEYGEPELGLLDTQDTTEPNGVKISIAVENEDIGRFVTEAANVYKRFKVQPNFTGATPTIVKEKIVLTGTDWRLLDGGDRAMAVMGNIAYPISFDDNCSSVTGLQGCPVEIDFPIGSLDIEAGRESLSYDKGTIAKLKSKIQQVVKEIKEKAINLVADCKNLYDARKKYITYNRNIRSLNAVIDKKSIKYNGQSLFDENEYGHSINIGQINIDPRKFRKNYKGTIEKRIIHIIDFSNDYIYVEADLKMGNIIRCHQYAASSDENIILVDLSDPAEKAKFLDTMGFDESYIVKASTLNYIRNSTPRQKSISLAEYKYNQYTTKCWKETTKTVADGGIYVVTEHGSIRNASGKLIHANRIQNVIDGLRVLDINIGPIYGIKKHLLPDVIQAGNWTNLWDYLKIELDNIGNDVKIQIANGKEIDKLSFYLKNRIDFYRLLAPKVSDLDIKTIVKQHKEITAKKRLESNHIQDIQYLFSLVNIPLDTVQKSEYDLEKIDNDITIKYPLLNHLSSLHEKSVIKEVASYISSKENYNG